jgi:hypothetical protein
MSEPKERWTPIEDPEYDYGTGRVPSERQLSFARDLLAIPGRFSVQMLASFFADEYERGFDDGVDSIVRNPINPGEPDAE